MGTEMLTISELYTKGEEKADKMSWTIVFPPDKLTSPTLKANRRYLDSFFFVPRFLESVTDADTSLTLFGTKLKTPAFCSPLSRTEPLSETYLTEIAQGLRNTGSLMMLGTGGSNELQSVIDTGVPVVKMVQPYRKTELIYEKVREAESRGCVAIGMDIDFFYGALRGERVVNTQTFGPQRIEELRQVISQTKLPFIIKGVLSLSDAVTAAQLGASAILVSNHGNPPIDFSLPAAIALPRIVDAVGSKLTVLVDTGFKTGNDVLKALALGARAVGFGSAMILAWLAEGTSGVEMLANQVTEELKRTMSATGCPNLSAITRSIIVQALSRE